MLKESEVVYLGCNYSQELVTLIQEGRVNVDYIKMGLYPFYENGYEFARSFGPVLLHGVARTVYERAGMKSLENIDWEDINAAITSFGSPHLGFHLDTKLEDWNNQLVADEMIIERLITATRIWASKISVPLMVENVPYTEYYGRRGALEIVTIPQIINKVCQEANVGLLLDLAHAKVTAWHRGEGVKDYLSQLPLERVMEIHVVGTMMTEDTGMRDRHLAMEDEDYQTLEWVLERSNPHVVTLEYGGPGELFNWRSDLITLERQLVRLREIVQ